MTRPATDERKMREALEQIAKAKYGLQGIMEDYAHDPNAYNYHAMKYWLGLAQSYQKIALEALGGNPTVGDLDAGIPNNHARDGLSHRHSADGSPYCERCGTEIDSDNKQVPGAELSWEPRRRHPTLKIEIAPEDRALAATLCRLTGWSNVSLRLKSGWTPEPESCEGQILSEIAHFRASVQKI